MKSDNEPLHLKYRPRTFEEFLGNDAMLESLKSIVRREGARQHTYLFQGPSGCGKTTLARIMKGELECSDRDFIEYNISQMRGIDTAREIINNSKFSPMGGKTRVYVLNECHKATPEFQNAMLDILEDPPQHVYFILCTTEPEKLLPTIRGQRASVFQVSRLPRPKIVKLLKDVQDKEFGNGGGFPDKHIQEIARLCDGSPRKALVMLDQIADIQDDEAAFQAILDSTVDEVKIKEIIDQLLPKGGKPSWKAISKLLKDLDIEPEQARHAIKAYLGSVFLNRGDDRVYQMMSLFLEPFHYSGREGLIDALYLACKV